MPLKRQTNIKKQLRLHRLFQVLKGTFSFFLPPQLPRIIKGFHTMVFHKIRYLHFIAKEAVYIFFAISLLFFIYITQLIFKKHKMPHKLFSQPMRHLILAHQNRLLHISASGVHISSVFSVFFHFLPFFLL